MDTVNQDQAAFWGASPSGQKWLTYEDRLDAALAPVLDLVLDRAGLLLGMRVLDIGCGTGASVMAAARQVGPGGHVLGVDISSPFLDRAQARVTDAGLTHVAFRHADAQIAAFEPRDRDALISRFGMMFFEDPTAAFANLAKTLRPGAHLTFATWGDLAQNPWFRIPFVAAVNQLGRPPKTDRNAPGPLAFHDIDRVTGLMREAGLSDAAADAVPLALTPSGSAEDTAELFLRVGPAGRVIEHFGGTAADIDAIYTAALTEITAFQTPEGVQVPGLINLYQAKAPAKTS